MDGCINGNRSIVGSEELYASPVSWAHLQVLLPTLELQWRRDHSCLAGNRRSEQTNTPLSDYGNREPDFDEKRLRETEKLTH